jgi:hypothetical protein
LIHASLSNEECGNLIAEQNSASYYRKAMKKENVMSKVDAQYPAPPVALDIIGPLLSFN